MCRSMFELAMTPVYPDPRRERLARNGESQSRESERSRVVAIAATFPGRRFGWLPAHQAGTPGQSGTEAAHQHQIASLNAAFTVGFVKDKRD